MCLTRLSSLFICLESHCVGHPVLCGVGVGGTTWGRVPRFAKSYQVLSPMIGCRKLPWPPRVAAAGQCEPFLRC